MKKMLYMLDNLEEYLAGLALLAMSLLAFMEVVFRYVFAHSHAWVEELLRYMMVWITFFGASVAIKYGAHMSVNVIEYIPARWLKRWIDVFVALLGLIFCVVTLYLSWLLVLHIKGFGQRTPALQIPMYIPYAIVPFGFASMAIRFTIKLIQAMQRLWSRAERSAL